MYEQFLTPTRQEYQAWGQRSNHQSFDFSPIYKSSGYQSTHYGSSSTKKSRNASRLEQAKQQIDRVIEEITEKRNMNREAIEQVRSVNSEIIEEMRRARPRSEFGGSGYLLQDRYQHQYCDYQRYQAQRDDDVYILESRIRQEQKRKEQIMLKISYIEKQNKLLMQNQQKSSQNSQRDAQLIAQNDRLRDRINQLSSFESEAYQQIEALKRQNKKLRNDASRMLNKQKY